MIMIPVQIKGISWHKTLALLGLLLCCTTAFAQNFSIKGVVTDKNGEPIVGATVLEQQTKNGVAPTSMAVSLSAFQTKRLFYEFLTSDLSLKKWA